MLSIDDNLKINELLKKDKSIQQPVSKVSSQEDGSSGAKICLSPM